MHIADAQSLEEELRLCHSFEQACAFHDQNKKSERYTDLFKENYGAPELFLYAIALKEPKIQFAALQDRFGPFWGESVLDFALKSGKEAIDALIAFCKKAAANLVIRHSKEKELIDKIEKEPIESDLSERIFDVFAIVEVDYETLRSPMTKSAQAIIEKMYLESRETLMRLISKPHFLMIWNSLAARKPPLSDGLLLLVQNAVTRLKPEKNRFTTKLTGQMCTEIKKEIEQKINSFDSSFLVQPKFSPATIDCIHLEGVCTGLVQHLAKYAVSIWDEDTFSEKLCSFAEKHEVKVAKEVYLTHLVYSRMHQQEFQWRGLLKQIYSETTQSSPEVTASVIFLLCIVFGISEEKIYAFMKELGVKAADLKAIQNAFCEHALVAGKFQRDASFEGLVQEMKMLSSKQQSEALQLIKAFCLAQKMYGHTFDDIFLAEDKDPSRSIAMRIYKAAIATKSDVQSYATVVDRCLYTLSNLVLEEAMKHQAKDDLERWQEWVQKADSGAYQFVLPGHNICLVKRKGLVYVLDPQNLLLSNRELVQFSVKESASVESQYALFVKHYPLDKKRPWQFSKVVAK
jgi:hypothetical protein